MGIGQALLTALLSGVFSGGILFGLTERKERRQELLQKAEAALEAYMRWSEALSRYPNMHYDLFGEPDKRGEARAKLEEAWTSIEDLGITARLLILVYLPNQYCAYTDVINSFRGFFHISADIKKASILKQPLSAEGDEQIRAINVAVAHSRFSGTDLLVEQVRRTAQAPHIVRWPPLADLIRRVRIFG